MSEQQFLHLAAITRDFSQHLISLGFTEQQVLGGTGITLEQITPPEAMAPFVATAEIFNRGVALTGDDLVHLKWAQERRLKRLGLIGYLGRTSPTLLDMLENMQRYQRTISEAIEVDLSELRSKGFYRWSNIVPATVDCSFFVEAQVAQLLSGLRFIMPRQFTPVRLSFAHHRAKNKEAFAKTFGCPVTFDAHDNEIDFHLSDLDTPLTTSDTALYHILRRHCDLVLAQTPNSRTDIRVQVEGKIADRLSTGQANIETVARDLGMSSRTLARRLGELDTTYQKVLSNLRQALAERYLKDGAMTQAEIAFLLGYSDVSSFAAAFKRWTGHSPGEKRRMT
ncbi:AraC family transcriptional regulator [Shimia haliotis]|uniref:Helix-turn-helix domain-containing protein n=1 Tax=Shimia haliotis TaxID=1280847 RepID=A0A1I4A008_9RHOB|nr:AraC family transcriptional regulator [Shimia haliotis]SFK49281.1 Helix-turn-helix domain-containing protein [Shimia haliotis]